MAVLFPEVVASHHIDIKSWHVLHTKSRQEKAVAHDLAARGVTHYLPTLNEVHYHSGRKVLIKAPVFPGYVFLYGKTSDAYDADRLGRLANILKVFDQEQLDRELSGIRTAVEGGLTLRSHPYFKQGTHVVVKSGPLEGLCGVVDTRERHGRLVLRLSMLGQAVSVDIDTNLLEAAS